MTSFSDILTRASNIIAAFCILMLLGTAPAMADWVVVGDSGEASGPADKPGPSDMSQISATGCSVGAPGPGGSGDLTFDSSTCDVFTGLANGEAGNTAAYKAQAAANGKPISLIVYDYSMGTTGGSCLSCDFLSFFMIALSDFSFSVYQFFYDAFLALVPITLLIWLGYRVAKLMVTGGEDGKGFLFSVVGKVALFAMIWLIALGANNDNRYLWDISGPMFLDFSFSLSNAVREAALTNSGVVNVSTTSTLFCPSVSTPMTDAQASGATEYPFVEDAMRLGCTTERVHFMGVASGIAILLSEKGGSLSVTDFASWGFYLLNLFVSLLLGISIIVTFVLSAIWLIFLVLDVVVRALVTAAFAPLIIAMFLYQPLRGISVNAFKMLVASAVTALSIGLVGILAFVLVTNAVNVYNATYADVDAGYNNYNLSAVSAGGGDPVAQMRAFLERVEIGSTDENRGIPLDAGSPWFWYLAFVGVAIFALGRKIISMLEQAVGGAGMSAMADRAVSMTRAGAKAGVVGATAGTAIIGGGLALGLTRGLLPMGSYLGGGLKQGGLDATQALKQNLGAEGSKNPLRSASGLKTSGGFGSNFASGLASGAAKGAKASAQGAMQGAARINNPGDDQQQ